MKKITYILVAILIGFNLASNLSKPITNLIKSANKISEGNFDAKVSETDQFQEIKVLLSSYNKMISEIENKQNELISKSQEDEEKRIFIEAILSLLTIGVISDAWAFYAQIPAMFGPGVCLYMFCVWALLA